MTLLERKHWTALVISAACGIAACSSTESLGTGDDGGTGGAGGAGGREGDGGESSTGGTEAGGASSGGTAGKSSGGTAGKSGSAGTAGKSSSGGTAGKSGSGGKNGSGGTAGHAGTAGTAGAGGGEDCSQVACAPLPPQCPPGTLIAKPVDNCCVQCVPKEQLPLAACIINGERYENGETIPRSSCVTCVCVDGVIGRCTGACPPGVDAGAGNGPKCSDSERLIPTCNTCNYEHCEAYEYECHRVSGCDLPDAGFQCGAEQVCFEGACLSNSGFCLI